MISKAFATNHSIYTIVSLSRPIPLLLSPSVQAQRVVTLPAEQLFPVFLSPAATAGEVARGSVVEAFLLELVSRQGMGKAAAAAEVDVGVRAVAVEVVGQCDQLALCGVVDDEIAVSGLPVVLLGLVCGLLVEDAGPEQHVCAAPLPEQVS